MNLRLDRIKNVYFRRLMLLICIPYGFVRHSMYAAKVLWVNFSDDVRRVWQQGDIS